MIRKRTENQKLFFENIDDSLFRDDFDFEGSSNYAFNLILKKKDEILMSRLLKALRENRIEYRRGSAGGGNQLRQPYLKNTFGDQYLQYPEIDHIHFFGMYLGNYPELDADSIKEISRVISGK